MSDDLKTVPILLRKRLERLAYRYLGSVGDAEDIVQDAMVKYLKAEDIRDAEAWLARAVTTGALDRLRYLKGRRETYIGPWLPEPVVQMDESASDRELDISYAVMRTLENLSPLERAAFFLHDLFDMDFDEVGKTLGRTPAATRKLASRARQRLRQEAPRFSATSPDVERVMSIIENAVQSGDLSELKNLLAADAELISDGGGKMLAALNIIRGRDAVARFIFGLGRKPGNEHLHPIIARFNDAAGIILASDRGTDSVITFDFDSVGRIIAIYLVRNPDKLDHLPTSASRMITPPSGRDTP